MMELFVLLKKGKRHSAGFTLIELMIVIAIISALAAIAIPNFISYRDKAFCENAEADAFNTIAAISSYYTEPENVIAPGVDILVNEEGLTLNNRVESVDITVIEKGFRVTVTDDSGRCPRHTSFVTTMGDAKGTWN